ncbi:MAG: hypothetical protein ACREVX_00705 [Clostridium sp.]|uniref:hypothetical protein n=1 Tax=Clostridium sp. TaxID=1506 RepID=UPI003D6CCD26
MGKFETYKSYKEKLNIINLNELGNIKIGNVLSSNIWFMMGYSHYKLIFRNVKNLLKISFLNRIKITYTHKESSKILFVNVVRNRKDYEDIYNKTKNIVATSSELIVSEDRVINIKSLCNIFHVIKYMKYLNNINKFNERLYFAIYLFEYKYLYDFIEKKVNKKYNLVVTFCDAHSYENIVAQYFNNLAVKTATLQHGQYMFNDHPDINSIAYENFISNYILSWGLFTNLQFKKFGISEDRLVMTGNAKYINYEFKTIEEKLNVESKGIFGLVLDGPSYSSYYESNLRLIEFANKLAKTTGLNYIIKLHPVDYKENYLSQVNKRCFSGFCKNTLCIMEYSNQVDFSLIYISSVYSELNMLLSPVFRYKGTAKFKLGISDGDEFNSYDELKDKYNDFLTNRFMWLNNVKKIGDYYMNTIDIYNNYKNFFDLYS